MLDYLQNKLKKIEREGGLEKLQEQWKERIVDELKHPKAVQNITKAETERHWTVDPTLVIEKDIKTPNGDVLASAGDRINPLHHLPIIPKGIIFIDGDDTEQVEFAKSKIDQFDIVLIKGAPFDLQESQQMKIYFDQGGYICQKYDIQHVPALFKIERDTIELEEVVLS